MMIISGSVAASISANTDNWDPAGTDVADALLITSSGTFNLTGIAAKFRGRVLTMFVVSGTIILKHNSSSSAVGNRFLMDIDTYLTAGMCIQVWYDRTNGYWRPLKWVPSVVSTSRLLGSSSTTAGNVVPITLGTGLSMSGTTLNGTPATTFSVVATNFSAAVGTTYFINAPSIVGTLPTTATRGERIDFILRSGTATFTVGRNTRNIQGVGEDMTVDFAPWSFGLVFDDTTNGWWLA